MDPTADLLIGNAAAKKLFGLPATARLSKAMPSFRTPTSRRDVPTVELPLQRAMRTGRAIPTSDYEVIRSDGMRRIVAIAASPLFGEKNALVGGLAVLTDVTYLRTLEITMREQRNELARHAARGSPVGTPVPGVHLPYKLPTVGGFALSAMYLAADSPDRLGGDWYDAFPLPDGRVGLSIGDVMGSGYQAAMTMTKLRQAIQSTALIDTDPRRMLESANLTLALHADEPFATAIAGVLDPNSATLTFASAGHPLPVLRRSDGSLSEFDGTGLPLGAPRHGPESHAMRMDPGDLAVFYTDGLIEASRDTVSGQRLLREALQIPDLLEAGNPAELLHRHILGSEGTSDDVAIMTIRRQPS